MATNGVTYQMIEASDAPADLILTEVFDDAPASDAEYEWVELYNTGSAPVERADWSLSWAGLSYGGAAM